MVKHDSGKYRLDLLPKTFLEETANVLEFGSKKYSANNWREGCDWSRYHAAMLRHITAWGEGETNDPESGINHLAHAACSIAFLLDYAETKTGHDDRYKPDDALKMVEVIHYVGSEPPGVISIGNAMYDKREAKV